jgi:hypothetical protein
MNTTVSTTEAVESNNYDMAVSLIGAVFGTAHFILQSAADLTAYSEGKLVEKVSNGEIPAHLRIQYRKNITEVKQLEMREKFAKMRAGIQAKKEQAKNNNNGK